MSHPAWATARLKATLVERGGVLRAPEEHRDAWLLALLDGTRPLFTVALQQGRTLTVEQLQEALNTAAGVLIELPRSEQDAWCGWDDPRVERVLGILRMAELPEHPPRVALRSAWERLRAEVPFELPAPRPGDPPTTFQPFADAVRTYLGGLEARITSADQEGEVASERAAGLDRPIPRRLLAMRLSRCVHEHVALVLRHVLPLAAGHWREAFAAKLSATSLHSQRGDAGRLGEGRALRLRSKLPRHLAAWVLKQAGLPRGAIGLFIHHVDPAGLQTALPEADDGEWKSRLEKEIDNSVASWTTASGARGDPPIAHLRRLERELRELMRPV